MTSCEVRDKPDDDPEHNRQHRGWRHASSFQEAEHCLERGETVRDVDGDIVDMLTWHDPDWEVEYHHAGEARSGKTYNVNDDQYECRYLLIQSDIDPPTDAEVAEALESIRKAMR